MSILLRSASRLWFTLSPKRSFSTFTVGDTEITIDALKTSYSYIWLRDSCQSPDCVHPSTLQKLHRTTDIPADIKPKSNGVSTSDEGLHVEWTTGHKSFYTHEFLKRHATNADRSEYHKDVPPVYWDAGQISQAEDTFLPYSWLQSTAGLLTAITQLSKYGLVFITGVPHKETSDDACELQKLARIFSEIRPTFYGDVWDVKNVRNSRNIAYTNLDLGLHMDLLYFQHPPRYQILHCLRNRVQGGMSIFVDAFHAANALRESSAADFNVLSNTVVPFHYINDGHHLHFEHPTIELASHPTISCPDPESREIAFVNFSPPFQAPLLRETPPEFYKALHKFNALLHDTSRTFNHTLKEGEAVIFDNRRVLHARTAFHDYEEANVSEGEANRWLKGCYMTEDALWDRGRTLREKIQKEM